MTNGTTSEALLPLFFDEPRAGEDPEALYALLEERIRRYTMGDSTSVPIDTARRLLESILYCLDLNRRFPARESSSAAPLRERWKAGVIEAARVARRAKLLLLQAQHMPPPLANTAYRDTMKALPGFFAAYDVDFFAHEIPCSFDYPLCRPVPDSLFGAEYMLDFLRRLLAENSLLRAFSPEALRGLYERYYLDYTDLLVNLFLPAAELSALCALTCHPVRALSLSPEELMRAGQMLAEKTETEARQMMLETSARALEELHIRGENMLHYTQSTALDLLVRLRATAVVKSDDPAITSIIPHVGGV